mmetsp:Transcript_23552/g.58662  ORF Transcript_23552/g.58662 Transcript_23552/m.58662 type:complete len:513 (+) Transcript_23552:160-1698(+)
MPPRAANAPPQNDTKVAAHVEGGCHTGAMQRLEGALRELLDESAAFRNDIAADLGKHTFGRQVGFSREGLQLAHDGVRAWVRHSDVTQGCIPTVCAIFDGLRIARRGAALTLIESQDATVLTATGMEALKELSQQVATCISMAQSEVGAVTSLTHAVDTLKASGLEGVGSMVETLESAAKKAVGITHDLKDDSAIAVAGRMRRLEVEVRPLVDAMDPLLSKPWDKVEGEILWETRMVNVGDIVTEVLRDVRAEVSGWAICADVAAELRRCMDPAAVSVAAGFDTASNMLRDEGVQKRGAESLHVIRQAISSSDASSLPEATQLLLRDAPRWLRECVGAAAVLCEAAAHRIPAVIPVCASANEKGAPADAAAANRDGFKKDTAAAPVAVCAAKVQKSLEAAAQHLASMGSQSQSYDQQSRSICTAAAAAEFRRAVLLARGQDSLQRILNEVDKDVAHLLGVSWSADPVNIQPASTTVDVGDVELNAPPSIMDAEDTARNEVKKTASGGCCTLL